MNTERKMYLKAMKNTEAPSLPVANGEFPNNIRANNIKTKLVSNNIKMK